MTGSERSAAGHGVAWRRPPLGGLVAAGGGVVTVASLFLPWYSLRLRLSDFATVSAFALIHLPGGTRELYCDPFGSACHESLNLGALAAGIWDWRTLIAVAAAATVLYVVIGAQAGLAKRRREWQVLIALGACTSAVTLAAAFVSPVSTLASAGRLGLTSSLAYGAAVGLVGALATFIGGMLLWRSERGASKGARLSQPVPQA